jgi:hypothetical protein
VLALGTLVTAELQQARKYHQSQLPKGASSNDQSSSAEKGQVQTLTEWVGAHSPTSFSTIESWIGTLVATLVGGLITFGFCMSSEHFGHWV